MLRTIFIVGLLSTFVLHDVECVDTHITKLFNKLFTNYSANVRPYCGDTDAAVNVRLDLALGHIVDLHEPTQILNLNVWVRMAWNDCQLTWNPSEFGNLSSLIIAMEHVWVPDLTLYDSTSPEGLTGFKDYRPAIYSDGSVYYNFPSVTFSQCNVDVEKFPYDTQACQLTFGSWAYHGLKLNLFHKNPYADLSSTVNNVEWIIESFSAARHVLYYNCCPEPYPDVTYYLTLTRKPLFYVVNIVIPTFLITGMGILGFLMPSESGEKVSLEITVMLALAVFQLLVADALPSSAESTPLLTIYFNFCLFIVGYSCIMAVVALIIHYKVEREMSRITKFVFLDCCAKLVFVTVPSFEVDDLLDTRTDKKGVFSKHSQVGIMHEENSEFELGKTNPNPRMINVNHNHWRAVALVVDRLSCLFFLLSSFICSVVIFKKL